MMLLVWFETWRSNDVIVTIFAGLLILSLWAIALLVWFRRGLRQAAATAQQWEHKRAQRRLRHLIVGVVLLTDHGKAELRRALPHLAVVPRTR